MEKFEYMNNLPVDAGNPIRSYGILMMVTMFLKGIASFTALLLMIVDRRKRKSTMLTSLLVPYLFVSLPLVIFHFLRREFGKWIAFLTVILRLFFPNHFPESLEILSATLLLIVTTPNSVVETFRDDLRMSDPVNVCLLTSLYLVDNHIRTSGGYRNSFIHKDKITYTICLLLLFVYPLWTAFAFLSYIIYIESRQM